MRKVLRCYIFLVVCCPLLLGCRFYSSSQLIDSPDATNNEVPRYVQKTRKVSSQEKAPSQATGENLLVGKKSAKMTEQDYLWKGVLTSLSFMELAYVGRDAGMVSTGWYENVESPGERYMINVVVLSNTLHLNSLDVTVRKQVLVNDRWIDTKFDTRMEYEVTRKIVNRAKKLRAIANTKR